MVIDVVLCRPGPRLESLCIGLDECRSVAGNLPRAARCTLGKSNRTIDTTVTTEKRDQMDAIERSESSQELRLPPRIIPIALWGELG
jgi:hypothetical protein